MFFREISDIHSFFGAWRSTDAASHAARFGWFGNTVVIFFDRAIGAHSNTGATTCTFFSIDYTAVIDEFKINYVIYLILMKLKPMKKEFIDLIISRLKMRAYLKHVFLLSEKRSKELRVYGIVD